MELLLNIGQPGQSGLRGKHLLGMASKSHDHTQQAAFGGPVLQCFDEELMTTVDPVENAEGYQCVALRGKTLQELT